MDQIYQLFNRYLNNECTVEEINFLFRHFAEAKDQETLRKLVYDAIERTPHNDSTLPSDEQVTEMYDNIRNRMHKTNNTFILWRKIAVAASVLIFIALGAYFFRENNKSPQNKASLVYQKILPGKQKAILILDDGRKIEIDEAGNGIIANQGVVEVSKTDESELVYKANSSKGNHDIKYNEIEIPRGGEFKVVLPDGTKVWLNSSSWLKFPTQFVGKERNVELIGEGYFEVAKNEKQPFIVKTGDMNIRVLGTHFNVSAYSDDQTITTTLVEGSVNVRGVKGNAILKPGQQSIYSGAQIKVKSVDTEMATAWKNGYFRFDDERIESIMKKVSRWYNVDIEYQGNVRDKKIWGMFSRNKSISELLANLELTKSIKFKIIKGDSSGKGRRIVVMP